MRRFLTPDVRPATAAMEKFFDLKEKSDQIVSTFKQQVDKLAGLTLEDLLELRLAAAQFTQEEVSGQIFQVIQETIDENITH